MYHGYLGLKNRHEHWLCWMSTGRKSGLMLKNTRTHAYHVAIVLALLWYIDRLIVYTAKGYGQWYRLSSILVCVFFLVQTSLYLVRTACFPSDGRWLDHSANPPVPYSLLRNKNEPFCEEIRRFFVILWVDTSPRRHPVDRSARTHAHYVTSDTQPIHLLHIISATFEIRSTFVRLAFVWPLTLLRSRLLLPRFLV